MLMRTVRCSLLQCVELYSLVALFAFSNSSSVRLKSFNAECVGKASVVVKMLPNVSSIANIGLY